VRRNSGGEGCPPECLQSFSSGFVGTMVIMLASFFRNFFLFRHTIFRILLLAAEFLKLSSGFGFLREVSRYQTLSPPFSVFFSSAPLRFLRRIRLASPTGSTLTVPLSKSCMGRAKGNRPPEFSKFFLQVFSAGRVRNFPRLTFPTTEWDESTCTLTLTSVTVHFQDRSRPFNFLKFSGRGRAPPP